MIISLADMVVKESGFGELIPEADVMIFDEAHQLPDIASQYFGQSLSSRQLPTWQRHHHRLPTELKNTSSYKSALIVLPRVRRIFVSTR
ncbi:hypothetical protein ACVXG9_08625 [Escherichia coli]